MAFVLDASAAASLFEWEIDNLLVTALKRRRTDRAEVVAQLGRLAELIPLATRDRRLAAAADAHGVTVVQL